MSLRSSFRSTRNCDFYVRTFVVFALFSTNLLFGQIQGVVIHSETGQPLAKVHIALLAADSSKSEYETTTDAQGRFHLRGVESWDGYFG